MCRRYSLACIDNICGRFRVIDPAIGFRSHFSIAPGSTNPVIVVHERAEAVMMQWGLVPHWTKDIAAMHRPINARAEDLAERPMFRDLLRTHRCIVPASGFFEWKQEKWRKIPFYIHVKEDPVFAFAGLYDVWSNLAGTTLATYTIITTAANDLMAPVHHRMPAISGRMTRSTGYPGMCFLLTRCAGSLRSTPPMAWRRTRSGACEQPDSR